MKKSNNDIKTKLHKFKEGSENSPGYKRLKEKVGKERKRGNALRIVAVAALIAFPITLISSCVYYRNNLFNSIDNAQERAAAEGKGTDAAVNEGVTAASSIIEQPKEELITSDSTLQEKSIDNPSLTVTYLHTKSGNCTFLESNGQTMLIDTGSQDDVDYIMTYLRDNYIQSLDYLVITSAQADTCGSAADIIEEMDVKNLVIPWIEKNISNLYTVTIKTAREKDVRIRYPVSGDSFALGNAAADVIAPVEQADETTSRTRSLMMRVSDNEKSFLFTGDAQQKEFIPVISWAKQNGYNLKSTVMLCSDHAILSGYSEAFYNVTSPDIYVIDCSENREAESDKITTEIQEKGGELYRMSRLNDDENIVAKTDGKQIIITEN